MIVSKTGIVGTSQAEQAQTSASRLQIRNTREPGWGEIKRLAEYPYSPGWETVQSRTEQL